MPATRHLPNPESADLIALTREIAAKELAPNAADAERTETFPREVFATLGRAGLLTLPYPEEFGGGAQPYEVYLQVLEEIGAVWASVGVGVSVHALSCFPLFAYGTDEQRAEWLPGMLSGEQLGAYCLSEAHAGSDPAAMRAKAVRDGDSYVLNGAKAWTTHGGEADFYTVMARTADTGSRGISCFHVPAGTPGLEFDEPEDKMGLMGSTTATVRLVDARVPAANLIGHEGQGLSIALAGLDAGRLGIAAVATGLRRPPQGRRPPLRPRGVHRQAGRHRQRDEGDDRRRPGPRRRRLHPRLPGGALHARGQGHADLRGHEPDPAPGHLPPPRPLTSDGLITVGMIPDGAILDG